MILETRVSNRTDSFKTYAFCSWLCVRQDMRCCTVTRIKLEGVNIFLSQPHRSIVALGFFLIDQSSLYSSGSDKPPGQLLILAMLIFFGLQPIVRVVSDRHMETRWSFAQTNLQDFNKRVCMCVYVCAIKRLGLTHPPVD